MISELVKGLNARFPEIMAGEGVGVWGESMLYSEPGGGEITRVYCPKQSDTWNCHWVVFGLQLLQHIWNEHLFAKVSNLTYGVDLISCQNGGPGFFIEVSVYPENDAHTVAKTYDFAITMAGAVASALHAALSDPDPICVCGVAKSEHALSGCESFEVRK